MGGIIQMFVQTEEILLGTILPVPMLSKWIGNKGGAKRVQSLGKNWIFWRYFSRT